MLTVSEEQLTVSYGGRSEMLNRFCYYLEVFLPFLRVRSRNKAVFADFSFRSRVFSGGAEFF